MKKPRVWKVTHHWINPRREEEELFSRRADAVRAVKEMESADFHDVQYSEIENLVTGVKGSRRWGKRSIEWSKLQADPPGEFPPAKAKGDGIQLSLAKVTTTDVDLTLINETLIGVSDKLDKAGIRRAEVDAAGVTK